MERIASMDEAIEELGNGYGGDQGPSEDSGNPGAAPELRLSHRTHSRYQDNALSALPGS